MKFEIRRAEGKDARKIQRLIKEWVAEGTSEGIRVPSTEQIIWNVRRNPVFIALVGNEIAGYLDGRVELADEEEAVALNSNPGQRFGLINGLYVKKKFRNMHLGQILVKRVLKEFKKLKLKITEVKAFSKELEKLTGFYRRFGFKDKMVDMVLRVK
jgi:N-acetylglutamate synthase-like GNAT family acetyltransferase